MLANLFLHYAFDMWMAREHPGCPFERYADDTVAHCDTENQARSLRDSIAAVFPGGYGRGVRRSGWAAGSVTTAWATSLRWWWWLRA